MKSIQPLQMYLAKRPYILAIVISLSLLFWMASGISQEHNRPVESEKATVIPKVKVTDFHATLINENVELYGRTEPDRTVTLRAEIDGKITQVFAKRGSWVKKGDVIARIESNDLPAQLAFNQALFSQRELEYQGALKLNKDGYQGKVQLTSAKANLQAVEAEIKRLEIAIANTEIKAPFEGTLNIRYVEQGDYVKKGDSLASIVDLNPLIIKAHATEHQVNLLSVGQTADIALLNQEKVEGVIRYIAAVADGGTNTFQIEIAIDNQDNNILAGISSEVSVPLAEVHAIKISPALLALDDIGNIGVKTVVNHHVKFTGINIVKSESDGIWLTGLGETASIITLGQGFVREGDEVNAIKGE